MPDISPGDDHEGLFFAKTFPCYVLKSLRLEKLFAIMQGGDKQKWAVIGGYGLTEPPALDAGGRG